MCSLDVYASTPAHRCHIRIIVVCGGVHEVRRSDLSLQGYQLPHPLQVVVHRYTASPIPSRWCTGIQLPPSPPGGTQVYSFPHPLQVVVHRYTASPIPSRWWYTGIQLPHPLQVVHRYTASPSPPGGTQVYSFPHPPQVVHRYTAPPSPPGGTQVYSSPIPSRWWYTGIQLPHL